MQCRWTIRYSCSFYCERNSFCLVTLRNIAVYRYRGIDIFFLTQRLSNASARWLVARDETKHRRAAAADNDDYANELITHTPPTRRIALFRNIGPSLPYLMFHLITTSRKLNIYCALSIWSRSTFALPCNALPCCITVNRPIVRLFVNASVNFAS